MFGLNRWSPFEDLLNVQRDVERMFNQFWSELPTRTAATVTPGFQVKATDDGWRIDIPMPGVDPDHVTLEAADNTLTIRAVEPASDKSEGTVRFEQSLTVPQFLDVEKVSASHRHGMLQLTLPLKDSVKPRRIQIDTTGDKKQIAAA